MRKKKPQPSPSPEAAIRNRRRQVNNRRDVESFLTRLLGLCVFVWLLFGVFFGLFPMRSEDMKPGIRYRDLQVVYRLPAGLYADDIVVYELDGQLLTGRVIGVPGDSIEIRDDRAYVNGSESYADSVSEKTPAYDSDVTYPLTLTEDQYFILGDDREKAVDSRAFGPVSRQDIVGKVITVIRRSSL